MRLSATDLPTPERQYRFHAKRRWLFDFAWPACRLAVEVEGLTHGQRGRHQTFIGYHRDCEKYNAALLDDWRVLRFSQRHVREDSAVPVIRQALALLGAAQGQAA